MRSGRLLSAAAVVAVSLMVFGCPRAGDRDKQQMLTFSAGGELRPDAEGAPLFATGKATEAFPDIMPFLVERNLVMVDFAGGVELGCQPLMREQIFRWPPEWMTLLSQTNIRVLNMADDHALDCGREALSRTVSRQLAEGFYIVGVGRDQKEAHSPVYLTMNGVTISMVSFLLSQPPGIDKCDECTGPSMYDRQALINSLKEMKKRSEHRLVIFHWDERDDPNLTESELGLVREAIDFGADLVLGYGPATAGGLYRIRGRWVVGSMGRLTGRESALPDKAADALFLSAEFTPDKMMNLRLVAVDLANGRPRLLRGDEGAAALSKLRASSESGVQDNSNLIEDILYLK